MKWSNLRDEGGMEVCVDRQVPVYMPWYPRGVWSPSRPSCGTGLGWSALGLQPVPWELTLSHRGTALFSRDPYLVPLHINEAQEEFNRGHLTIQGMHAFNPFREPVR